MRYSLSFVEAALSARIRDAKECLEPLQDELSLTCAEKYLRQLHVTTIREVENSMLKLAVLRTICGTYKIADDLIRGIGEYKEYVNVLFDSAEKAKRFQACVHATIPAKNRKIPREATQQFLSRVIYWGDIRSYETIMPKRTIWAIKIPPIA